MHETRQELEQLQELLDRSAASAGPHLRDIITDDRRLSAQHVSDLLRGMFLLVVSTVTADGRPLSGPVDGYFLHGALHFSSGRDAVRIRQLARRPGISASHVPHERLAVTVHGQARLYDLKDREGAEQRQAMIDHYLPIQGPSFVEWLDGADAVGVRIEADRMFTFHSGGA